MEQQETNSLASRDQFNIYLAAIFTNQYMKGQSLWDRMTDREQECFAKIPNILESYHYLIKRDYPDEIRANRSKVFLDSGAFSAFTLGQKIDLASYVSFIKRNKDIIYEDDGILMAAVLDSIGDPQETYMNQQRMELMGIRPVPCFHAGEDDRYLEYYVKNYDYISLGGMVGSSAKVLIKWLDRIWDRYLVDGSGRAKLKVHGFGITSIPIMQRYPWYSCDSSSWVQNTSFGTIQTADLSTISVSEKSPSKHDKGQHFTNMSDLERGHIDQYIQRKGFTYDRLSKEYVSRAAFNVMAYTEIGESISCERLKHSNIDIL